MSSQINIEELPFEMLQLIMTYLNPGDRRDASLVSTRFADASHAASKICLHFQKRVFSDRIKPLNAFLKSRQRYSRMKLNEMKFEKSLTKFGQKFGSNLTELTIIKCDSLTPVHLYNILKSLKVLKTLSIKLSDGMKFLKGEAISTAANNKVLTKVLNGVTKLQLLNFNIDKTEFIRLMALFPNLETFHFDLKIVDGYTGVSYDDALSFVRERSGQLKEVCFGKSCSVGLPEVDLGLVHLSAPFHMPKQMFERFLGHNTKLTGIGGFFNAKIKTENLLVLPRMCPNLDVIHLECKERDEPALSDLDFLVNFTNLRSFRLLQGGELLLSDCALVRFSDDDHKLHDMPTNPNLQYLHLTNMAQTCYLCITVFTEKFPNLRTLKIIDSDIDDYDVQQIFKGLPLLTNLSFMFCEITDTAITGFDDESLSFVPELSLSNLKHLRTLNLTCTNLTDLSFVNSFDLPELRKLKMESIREDLKNSLMCVSMLVKKCPMLEYVSFRYTEITDKAAEVLEQNLRRLKVFN